MQFHHYLKHLILRLFIICKIYKPAPKISILIPFSSKDPERRKAFKWVIEYWKHELPDAEIVVGKSRSKVFCKGEALNDAFRRSKGRVVVIMDADAYIYGNIINRCADRILEEQAHGNNLWYVPYRHLYRLTKEVTEQILHSDPQHPLRISSPPPYGYTEKHGHNSKYGHRYGAMCMMFPREAIKTLGCFSEKFKGWGAEDITLLRALDTLWGKHKTTNNDILHLWHPFIGPNYKTRIWAGQEHGGANDKLANKYNKATGHPSKMRRLVDEGCRKCH